MKAPKRYKTLKKEVYYCIANAKGDYLTINNKFEPFGDETLRFSEPITADRYADNEVEIGYYEIHRFENYVKKLLI